MTCFRVGQFGNSKTPQFAAGPSGTSKIAGFPSALSQPPLITPRPFVEFSPHQDRAKLMPVASSLAPSANRRRRRRRRAPKTQQRRRRRRAGGAGKRRRSRTTRVRLIRGKLAIRLKGYPGLQHLGASQLVKFVPLNRLKVAARKALGGARAKPRRRTTKRAGGRRRRRR